MTFTCYKIFLTNHALENCAINRYNLHRIKNYYRYDLPAFVYQKTSFLINQYTSHSYNNCLIQKLIVYALTVFCKMQKSPFIIVLLLQNR